MRRGLALGTAVALAAGLSGACGKRRGRRHDRLGRRQAGRRGRLPPLGHRLLELLHQVRAAVRRRSWAST